MSTKGDFDIQLTPNGRTIWHWAIKGYGGVTTILERLYDSGTPIDEDQLEELEKAVVRLAELVLKLKTKHD